MRKPVLLANYEPVEERALAKFLANSVANQTLVDDAAGAP
jgi:hypothetical protein